MNKAEELTKEAAFKLKQKQQSDYEACLAMFPSGVGEVMCKALQLNISPVKKPKQPKVEDINE